MLTQTLQTAVANFIMAKGHYDSSWRAPLQPDGQHLSIAEQWQMCTDIYPEFQAANINPADLAIVQTWSPAECCLVVVARPVGFSIGQPVVYTAYVFSYGEFGARLTSQEKVLSIAGDQLVKAETGLW